MITLYNEVEADAGRVFEILSTTEGQRAFWTQDCDITEGHARFGFPHAPVDLHADVTTEPGKLVRMHCTEGFPYWGGSTWEWELDGSKILFRHYGFGEGFPEPDLGRVTQGWAMIHDRLVRYANTGQAQPFFEQQEATDGS
ncbi:hypothetical protein Lesp02_06840 [Lentzea sp. NBRC 105346]|uniref:hypothetical protein n=1 Tax=Lentzea sp. NBRC 105346 TaxID=3032205 RepID=UPI00249FC60B|nr:hypothetical protein [Lentzea sp. NBRC 105346]GLZ28494.1 hypothetical protein Lesp02_06840 [Lentzea sp. NBRC 105346]